MPLDKVLINHLDNMDKLEDDIDENITEAIDSLDVNSLIDDPEAVLFNFIDELKVLLQEKYYPEASKNGLELAKNIREDGDIEIARSNDPNLNEDLVGLDLAQGDNT